MNKAPEAAADRPGLHLHLAVVMLLCVEEWVERLCFEECARPVHHSRTPFPYVGDAGFESATSAV
jgi:hypothetical protein